MVASLPAASGQEADEDDDEQHNDDDQENGEEEEQAELDEASEQGDGACTDVGGVENADGPKDDVGVAKVAAFIDEALLVPPQTGVP